MQATYMIGGHLLSSFQCVLVRIIQTTETNLELVRVSASWFESGWCVPCFRRIFLKTTMCYYVYCPQTFYNKHEKGCDFSRGYHFLFCLSGIAMSYSQNDLLGTISQPPPRGDSNSNSNCQKATCWQTESSMQGFSPTQISFPDFTPTFPMDKDTQCPQCTNGESIEIILLILK